MEGVLIEHGLAEIAPHEDARAHELFVRYTEFLDDEIVIKCVDVLVVDDSPDHPCASEHENVRVCSVDGVDLLVAHQLDACYLGFPWAADVRDA